jgi:hypothetical protein
MKGYEKSLKEFETRLGDHNNLVLLRDTIAAAPETYGKDSDLDLLFTNIDKFQEELRSEALEMGRLVYHEGYCAQPPPGEVRARLWYKSSGSTWKPARCAAARQHPKDSTSYATTSAS